MRLVSELRRRNVLRMALLYAVAAWLIVQVAEVLIDLARGVSLADHVTVAVRANLITHRNVGYRDHPLQKAFPPQAQPIVIGSGSFVGAGATILAGVRLGERCFVAAGAVVHKDVPAGKLVAGVPAEIVRDVDRP